MMVLARTMVVERLRGVLDIVVLMMRVLCLVVVGNRRGAVVPNLTRCCGGRGEYVCEIAGGKFLAQE